MRVAHSWTFLIRSRICPAVASALGGPPQTRRSSVWTTPCGLPLWCTYAPTIVLSCLRSSSSSLWETTGRRSRQLQEVRLGVRLLAAVRDLPGLALLEEELDLVGFEEAGDAEVVLLLLAAGMGLHAELGAVVEDAVEDGVGLQGLEGQHVLLPGVLVLLLLGLRHLLLGLGVRVLVLARLLRPVERVVALDLHLVGEAEEAGDRGQEHGRGLAAPAGAHEAADGLGEEERGRDRRGVHPDREAGTSTPSDTMRTATIQRSSLSLNSSMRFEAPVSSERTRVGRVPVISRISLAYARADSWSEAMTRPPASGMDLRTSMRRWSAARSTFGIQSPRGSRAVRQACEIASLVIGSPRRAAISSPALVRQRMLPL